MISDGKKSLHQTGAGTFHMEGVKRCANQMLYASFFWISV